MCWPSGYGLTTLHHHLPSAPSARGTAIVIDVFRAFTVACHAFASGASRYLLAPTSPVAARLAAAHPSVPSRLPSPLVAPSVPRTAPSIPARSPGIASGTTAPPTLLHSASVATRTAPL
jgi:hypothetical protein